jgi:hypothetical protein
MKQEPVRPIGLDSRLRGNDKGVGFIRADNGIFVAITGKSWPAVCITNVPDRCNSLPLEEFPSKIGIDELM